MGLSIVRAKELERRKVFEGGNWEVLILEGLH